ncbi:MAG: RecX family transcriptional regulator [Thermoleophilia bacterium]
MIESEHIPVVTALRAQGGDRVAVDLDGRRWRIVPLEAVYVAGLSVGAPLHRTAARALGRELRRLEARHSALRALRFRDHTVASLEQRLCEVGAAPSDRREALEAAQRSGLVDDRRLAVNRAEVLAGRGVGDDGIVADLERQGVGAEDIRRALGVLEREMSRALEILERRGRSSRTVRHLAAKGFSEETIEQIVADVAADAVA